MPPPDASQICARQVQVGLEAMCITLKDLLRDLKSLQKSPLSLAPLAGNIESTLEVILLRGATFKTLLTAAEFKLPLADQCIKKLKELSTALNGLPALIEKGDFATAVKDVGGWINQLEEVQNNATDTAGPSPLPAEKPEKLPAFAAAAPPEPESLRIALLHLTDFHQGATNKFEWAAVRQPFFDDIKLLRKLVGKPWDGVIFTGDAAFSGGEHEFDAFNSQLFKELWRRWEADGEKPWLVSVPGNHDLKIPKRISGNLALLRDWNKSESIRDLVLNSKKKTARNAVANLFSNYKRWCGESKLHLPTVHEGIFPGDFSASFDLKNGFKLGVVGLNTSFLQYTKGLGEGTLAVHKEQFGHACQNGDCDAAPGHDWCNKQNLCLLLTHHPLNWLHQSWADELQTDIYQPQRFGLHLCGHNHVAKAQAICESGSHPRHTWLGSSLFGREHIGDGKVSRIHGYSAITIDIRKNHAGMRIWPRKGKLIDRSWNMLIDTDYVPDPEHSQHCTREFSISHALHGWDK